MNNYLIDLNNTFENFISSYVNKNYFDKSLKGRVFELITCIKFNCKMLSDVNSNFKVSNGFDILDNGIDYIDDVKNICYQCKFYEDGNINRNSLNGFINYCCDNGDKFKYVLVKTSNIRVKNLPKKIEVINISEDEIKEYIFNSYLSHIRYCNNSYVIKDVEINEAIKNINNNIEILLGHNKNKEVNKEKKEEELKDKTDDKIGNKTKSDKIVKLNDIDKFIIQLFLELYINRDFTNTFTFKESYELMKTYCNITKIKKIPILIEYNNYIKIKLKLLNNVITYDDLKSYVNELHYDINNITRDDIEVIIFKGDNQLTSYHLFIKKLFLMCKYLISDNVGEVYYNDNVIINTVNRQHRKDHNDIIMSFAVLKRMYDEFIKYERLSVKRNDIELEDALKRLFNIHYYKYRNRNSIILKDINVFEIILKRNDIITDNEITLDEKDVFVLLDCF